MRPSPPTTSSRSSEEGLASAVLVEEEENKDEMLDIYRTVIDCLMQTSDDEEEACKLARNQLALKLNHHEISKSNEIRHRLLKHFQAQGRELKEFVGLRRLLGVVLDEKMDMVEIPCRDEDVEDCLDDHVFSILINRCPNLQSLHFHCSERSVWIRINLPKIFTNFSMCFIFFC